MEVKMMIVMRKDLNMRKGKMVAQGCHAAVGLCLDIEKHDYDIQNTWANGKIADAYNNWLESSFKKICVSVNSESELLSVADKAKAAGLMVKVITDAGHTEFNGVPTITCLAISPATTEELTNITGNLPLL
jgi:PTH2 family peptidyl-tRNA hydrolase